MSVAVYVAAPYPEKARALRVANGLAARGITVTSRWLNQVDPPNTDQFARQDLADILRCDVLVALNPSGWGERGTGGRHVEFGYALALGIPVLLVGERTNVFHHLEHVKAVDDTEDLAKHINRLAATAPVQLRDAAKDLLRLERDEDWRGGEEARFQLATGGNYSAAEHYRDQLDLAVRQLEMGGPVDVATLEGDRL